MSDKRSVKRLQVLIPHDEYVALQASAAHDNTTVSEWVRAALRQARRARTTGDGSRKLDVIRAASAHSFPAGEVEEMLAEIGRGRDRP